MRAALAVGFLFAAASWGQNQPFEIVLPANVLSETVAIRYALVGPFGGYGTWTEFQRGLRSYPLETAHAGAPATRLRAIVYAPGCALQKLDVPLADSSSRTWNFPCDPVAPLPLTGIVRAQLPETLDQSEIRVNYVAEWALEFFGIRDGLVTTFPIAQSTPGPGGHFRVSLPGLSGEALTSGAFRFWLRDKKTGALRAELIPTTGKAPFGTLKAADTYPGAISFTVCVSDSAFDRKLTFAKRGEPQQDACSQ